MFGVKPTYFILQSRVSVTGDETKMCFHLCGLSQPQVAQDVADNFKMHPRKCSRMSHRIAGNECSFSAETSVAVYPTHKVQEECEQLTNNLYIVHSGRTAAALRDNFSQGSE